MIRLGDKEVEYNPEFKFYITTKLSNPHYTPEIATKTTIVNFAVKEQGRLELLLQMSHITAQGYCNWPNVSYRCVDYNFLPTVFTPAVIPT